MMYFEGDPRPYLRFKKNPNDTKDTVCCKCKFIDQQGNRFMCNYEKRIDHHRKAIKEKKYHVCTWVRDTEQQEDIRNFAQEATQDENDEVSPITLFDQLCILVGRLNLSLENACSDTMYSFIRSCAEFGMCLARSYKDPEERFTSEFPQPKRDKFRQRFISLAYEINRKRMKQFTSSYSSLSLDEGSTLKTQYLDYVLHDTKHKLGEYVATTEVMTGGKAKDYVNTIPKGLDLIEKFKVKVSTVVVDGNTAQLKAFKESYHNSLRHLDNDMIKKLIVVPCLCHRINNAYKFVVLHDNNFNKLVTSIRNIAKVLNDSDCTFTNKCPTFIETRWIYDYDIIRYFKKHINEINQYLQSQNHPLITEDMIDLENMLMILKKLTLIFEDANQPLSSAYKIIESAIDAMKEVSTLSKNPNFYREMHVSLKNYTISSKEGNLWLLSYILTPKGFDDITKRKNGFKRKKGTLKDFQFHSNVSSQDTDENQNDFIRQKTIETFYQEETQQVDPTITVTKQEVKSYFRRALSGISEICDILKYSKDEKEIVEKQFDAYLLNSFKEACPNFRPTIDGNSYNWEIIMEDPLFRNFADIALRLEPTPCSEASAERAISLQRLVILKRRNKALKELIDARLIYMRCQTKKFLDKYYF